MMRLWRDRRGGVGILVAAGLPMLIGAGAIAVDLGSVQLETRRLQGIADAAALAAATDPTNAQTRAQAVFGDSGWPRAATVRTTPGRYSSDPTVAPSLRFTGTATTPDAARVTIESQSPTFLARVFGLRSVTISRTATAARQRFAEFSIGSRLASLNGGILNSYLGALTGSNISLSVMDYNGLAGADVDLFEYLPALRTRAAAQAVTFDEVLNAQVSTPQALNALADTLGAQHDTGSASAVRTLAASVPGGQTITLNALLDAGPIGGQSSGGTGVAAVNALAFATAMLQLATPNRQISLDLGAGIPGLASTRLTLAVGERAQQSPWIAISDSGTPIVRTAQTRAYLEAKIAPTALPGLASLASIRVPIFLELASAEGKVSAIACPSTAGRSVTIDARTSPGQAALGNIDTARLQDFSSPITPTTAKLVDTLLVDVTGSARVDIGAAEPWQPLRFDKAAIDARSLQTVQSSTPVSGIATSLLRQPKLAASVPLLGLSIALDPLIKAVGTALGAVADPIDDLLGLITGAVGVGIGEADVRVTGIRCGQPVLVA